MGKQTDKVPSDEARVQGFIDKFTPEHQALIRQARQVMRTRFPTSFELVYDNYNFFVLGYSPTERPSESIVSLTAASNGLGLCFLQGAALSDPLGLLQGKGKQTRFIRLPSVDVLFTQPVRELLEEAEAYSPVPMREDGEVELIIRSVSEKQRPRQ